MENTTAAISVCKCKGAHKGATEWSLTWTFIDE